MPISSCSLLIRDWHTNGRRGRVTLSENQIEVSQQDAEALEFMQTKCRGLYNWWVMKLHNGERWNLERAKKSLRESKQYDPELRYVYGKLLHEVYFRLDKAMQAFFRRLKAGEKPGFPRFKPRHQFFTLCYPAMYLEVHGNSMLLPTETQQTTRLSA